MAGDETGDAGLLPMKSPQRKQQDPHNLRAALAAGLFACELFLFHLTSQASHKSTELASNP